jgi:signal peptidase I
MIKFKAFMKETGSILLMAIILAAVLKLFIIDSRVVPTSSMYPTVHSNDRVLVDKLSYRFRDIRRQDIVVFRLEGEKYDLLKRVIGLPGDRIRVADGKVYINDEPLDEPYLAEAPTYLYEEVAVPEGHIFLLGDNRNRSNDSHYWDEPFVPVEDVKGRAFFCYWPFSHFGSITYNPAKTE